MTAISEMLVRGEAGAGSTISIDATDDGKGLKFEVADPVPVDTGDDLAPVTNGNTDGDVSSEKTNPACVASGAGLNLYLPIKALLARLTA